MVAFIERALSPAYSFCCRCRRPWRHRWHHRWIGVVPHITDYAVDGNAFALCETCWHDTESPAARMPYYEDAHSGHDFWPRLAEAVRRGGQVSSTATDMEPVKAFITTPDGWRLEGWGTTSAEASHNLLRALNAWVQVQGQK